MEDLYAFDFVVCLLYLLYLFATPTHLTHFHTHHAFTSHVLLEHLYVYDVLIYDYVWFIRLLTTYCKAKIYIFLVGIYVRYIYIFR